MTEPILIDIDELESRRDEVVLCDVRWYLDGRSGRQAFLEGHLPGAIFVDLDEDLSDAPEGSRGRHPFPSAEAFATRLGALGIADGSFVVAYDDSGGGTSGRLAWMLRSIGERAAVLNGGMAAYRGELETGSGGHRDPVMRAIKTWPDSVAVDAEELVSLPDDEVLIDARTAERFLGDAEPTGAPAGHIPGARNLYWADLLDPTTGRYLEPEELRAKLAAIGVDGKRAITASCGSGVSACALLVGIERAGLGTGKLFVPSWSGWTAAGRAIETGPAKRF